MLLNVSYNKPDVFAQIDTEVGRRYGFFERIKNGGIGSPKLFVNSASIEIQALYDLDSYLNTCNIELRPKGIIVRFRSILETFALPIPYYKLTLYKGSADEYTIYRDQHFLNIKGEQPAVVAYFKKLQEAKTNFISQFERPF